MFVFLLNIVVLSMDIRFPYPSEVLVFEDGPHCCIFRFPSLKLKCFSTLIVTRHCFPEGVHRHPFISCVTYLTKKMLHSVNRDYQVLPKKNAFHTPDNLLSRTFANRPQHADHSMPVSFYLFPAQSIVQSIVQ